MNFFHLFSIAVMAAGFSGKPAGEKAMLPPKKKIISIEKKEANGFIPWTDEKLLSWDDFLCEPKKGTDAVASTSTSLGIAYQMQDGQLSYDISCNFSKDKSWGLMKTDYILAHEQAHFDITEIFARKLNEALENYRFNKKTFKKDISAIYQSIVKQKEDFQKLYDGETDHSRNKRMQYNWLEEIQLLLDETAPYASYP